MVSGSNIEDVANILGDKVETIREHYLKWSPEYQARTVMLLNRVHGFSQRDGDSDMDGSRNGRFEEEIWPKEKQSDMTLKRTGSSRAN